MVDWNWLHSESESVYDPFSEPAICGGCGLFIVQLNWLNTDSEWADFVSAKDLTCGDGEPEYPYPRHKPDPFETAMFLNGVATPLDAGGE